MGATDTSSWVERRAGLASALCDVGGYRSLDPIFAPSPICPWWVAALLTTAKPAKPTVFGDAKSAMRATLLLCHPSLLLGRCIGIILEFEKAEPEPVIGEL